MGGAGEGTKAGPAADEAAPGGSGGGGGAPASCTPTTTPPSVGGPGVTLANFRLAATLKGHTRAVSCVRFAPEASGPLLASASADKTVRIWNYELALEQQRASASGTQPARPPAVDAEQQNGEAGSGGSHDAEGKGQEEPSTATAPWHVGTLSGHLEGVNDVAWNSGARNVLASASDDRTVKLWDVEAGRCLRTLRGHTNFVFCCTFDPQGHLLATGGFDEVLRLWDVRNGKCLREVPAHSDPITSVDFSYDGTLIATSSLDGLLRIWDAHSGQCLKTIFGNDCPPVTSARFTPNAKYVLAGSLDGALRLWRYQGPPGVVKTYAGGHVNKQFCLFSGFCWAAVEPPADGAPAPADGAAATAGNGSSSSSGGKQRRSPWVVTGSEDHSIAVYDLNEQKLAQRIPGRQDASAPGPGHCAAVLATDCHPSRPLLATGAHAADPVVKLWQHDWGSTDGQEQQQRDGVGAAEDAVMEEAAQCEA